MMGECQRSSRRSDTASQMLSKGDRVIDRVMRGWSLDPGLMKGEKANAQDVYR